MAKPKTSRRVIAPRLDDYVEAKLGAMMSYSEVVDQAVAEFGCNERTVTSAIARVRHRWTQINAEKLEQRRAVFLADIRHAWKGALAAGDFRAIGNLARVRADVEGVKAPQKIEHSGELGLRPVAALSPQEREREIEILLAKRAAGKAAYEAAKAAKDGIPAMTETTQHDQDAAMIAVTSVVTTDADDDDDDEDLELAPDIRPATKARGTAKKKPSRVH